MADVVIDVEGSEEITVITAPGESVSFDLAEDVIELALSQAEQGPPGIHGAPGLKGDKGEDGLIVGIVDGGNF